MKAHFTSRRRLPLSLALLAAAALTPPAVPQDASPPPAAPAPPAAAPAPPVPAFSPPKFNNARQVRVDVLMVSLPQTEALALLPDLRDEQKLAAAQARLLAMAGRKEATLKDWPELTASSGVRAVCEDIVEFRYPILYDLPKAPAKPAPDAAGKPAPEEPLPPGLAAGVATPTEFETKNTGAVLELEAAISEDASAVALNVSPQLIELERMAEFPAGRDAKGQPVTISQPIFRVHKVSTNLTLRDGERRLIYVGKPIGPEAPIHLFIVGAKILPAINLPPAPDAPKR